MAQKPKVTGQTQLPKAVQECGIMTFGLWLARTGIPQLSTKNVPQLFAVLRGVAPTLVAIVAGDLVTLIATGEMAQVNNQCCPTVIGPMQATDVAFPAIMAIAMLLENGVKPEQILKEVPEFTLTPTPVA